MVDLSIYHDQRYSVKNKKKILPFFGDHKDNFVVLCSKYLSKVTVLGFV